MQGKDRKAANKAARREALREELKSREYIRQIHGILSSEYDNSEIPQAKMKMDGYFRLLAKTLPDLKATEITGEDGEPVKVSVSVKFK